MKPMYKIFRDAKIRISKNGWIQNRYGNYREGYCLLGSLGNINGDNHYDALGILQTITRSCSIVNWNDSINRTKEDVLDVLTKAKRMTR